jgi:hypothetical protein
VSTTRNSICEIKVTLRGIRPPIWRRLHVPSKYSFWDLHVAIQDSMGWLDYHLHEFRVVPAPGRRSLRIGIPDEDAFVGDRPILPGWKIPISKYLFTPGQRIAYNYDFGDDWQHTIQLERFLPVALGASYPACVAGRRRCPPEDVGGVGGYLEFLKALGDPAHEEHESFVTWVGGSFDPEAFDPTVVRFHDPAKRWRIAFLDEEDDNE